MLRMRPKEANMEGKTPSDGLPQQEASLDAACFGEDLRSLEVRLLTRIEDMLKQFFDIHSKDLRDVLEQLGAGTFVQEQSKVEVGELLIEEDSVLSTIAGNDLRDAEAPEQAAKKQLQAGTDSHEGSLASNSHFHLDQDQSKGAFQVLEYIKVHQAFSDKHQNEVSLVDKALLFGNKIERQWKQIAEPQRTGPVFWLVNSRRFEIFVQFAIILNAALLAYAADWQVQHIGMQQQQILDIFETSFVIFFLVELILRLVAHRLYFFVNKNMYWNIFDFFLVFISAVDFLINLLFGTGSGSYLIFRMCRLFKLARVLRSLRLFRFISSLTVLLDAFLYSTQPLFWGCMLFVFVLYMFSLIFIEGVIVYVQAEDNDDPIVKGAMMTKFGSLGTAIISLYRSVSGGEDWITLHDLLQKCGPVYGYLFLVFVVISSFAIANLVTAMVVDQAMAAAEPNRFEQIMDQRRKFLEQKMEFLTVCRKMDTDRSGKISWSEFQHWISSPLMVAYMASVDLDIYDAKVFFTSVAHSRGVDMNSWETAEVSIERFVEGCIHMKGVATAIDMQRQLFEIDMLGKDVKRVEKLFTDRMITLEKLVSDGFKFLKPPDQLQPANVRSIQLI